MKRLLIIISVVTMMFADSPIGNWKLSGLRVDYFDIARQDATVAVVDAYGFGITVPLAAIPAGALFNTTINGPFTNATLQGAGINLNVNLYPDGTGVIGEGSYYPDVDIGTNADGSPDCITTGQIFPITDSFNWETEGGQEGNSFPAVNILGIPSANAWAGQTAYGLGVNGSSVFDNWSSEPQQVGVPYVIGGIGFPDGTVFPSCSGVCYGGLADAYFGGNIEACMSTCMADPVTYGAATPGAWGGYYRQGDLGESQVPFNDANDVKFLLEWSAIDGWESESGLGDELYEDEDGDGTEFDRIFGVPYISSTFVNNTNPLCDITGGALTGANPSGLAYPVAGDIVAELGGEAAVGALVTGTCLEGVAGGAYDSCIGQVYDGVYAQCEGAGGPVGAVTGLCYDASQSDDFAGACAYYGAAGALVATCLQLGFSDEVCASAGEQGVGGVEAYCVYMTGVDCATAGINQCDVLTNPEFSLGLCGTLAASLTESETCEEWVDSFYDYDEDPYSPTYGDIIGDSFFDANAASVLGVSCTDFAAGLQAGLAAGDPGTIATIDGLFASAAGMSCTDYGANYVGMCVEEVAGANTMYLMDPSLETWGLFLTYNAASVQQYQAAGYDLATIAMYFPELFVNDSAVDFDPTCYYTGAPCGGRLLMNFQPTCVPEVEAHQIVAEFMDLDALGCEGTGDVAGGWEDLPCYDYPADSDFYTGCECQATSYAECAGGCNSGDPEADMYCMYGCANDFLCADGVWDEEVEAPAGDGIVNVVDVVKLVGHILGTTPLGGYTLCEADLNGDGLINVVDVVFMVNMILAGTGLDTSDNDATTTYINYSDTEVTVETDGYVGAIDITIEFDGNFAVEIAEKFAATSGYVVEGNSVHAVIVSMNADGISKDEVATLINYEGKILSVTAEAANSKDLTDVEVSDGSQPFTFEIKNAYPNPFNPSTTLEMTLDKQMDVSIKVYNLTGQLVDVISESTYMPGNHAFTWNANNLASGVYFISTQAGNTLNTQKVMLIK